MLERRSSIGYYVGAVVLAALIVAGVGLVVAMIARPGAPDASVLAVTDRSPIPCPDHQQDVTCFETQVTNNGGVRTDVQCTIGSIDGSQATFVGGATTTQIQLDADQSVHLDSILAEIDGTRARPPVVSCDPLAA